MAKENEQGQEKTERPTPRKVREARKKGNVPRSMEINSAAVMIGGLSMLVLFGGWILHRMMTISTDIYLGLGQQDINLDNLQSLIANSAKWMLITLSPFFIAIPLIGIAINVLQFGFLFSPKAVEPKLDKLNPVKGFKNLLNQEAFVRLLMNMAKVFVVGWVAFLVVKSAWPDLLPLMDSDVPTIFVFISKTILKVFLWCLLALTVLALIDFLYQRHRYTENLKMSKQEVKDEHRMQEGDPAVKRHQRQMQFQIAFNTMIKELPNADVVVTNPVHVAVALKYNPDTMAAPKVVGKGMRKLAERIKAVAREHDIPIVENPPLARALYKHSNVGDEIPGQFYQDVAEIIAWIYRMRSEKTPV